MLREMRARPDWSNPNIAATPYRAANGRFVRDDVVRETGENDPAGSCTPVGFADAGK